MGVRLEMKVRVNDNINTNDIKGIRQEGFDAFAQRETTPRVDLDSIKPAARRRNPLVLGVAALTLITAPAAGLLLSGVMSNAAEQPAASAADADALKLDDADVSAFTTDSQASDDARNFGSKIVRTEIGEHGHIEAVDNATVSADTSTLTYVVNIRDAKFRTVADEGYEVESVKADGNDIQASDGTYTLLGDASYTTLAVTFKQSGPTAEELAAQKAAEEAAAKAAANAAAAQKAAASSTAKKQTPAPRKSTTTRKQSAPSTQQAQPQKSAPTTQAAPATSAQTMTADELATAHAIFDAYNSFRASKGLSRVSWSDACANMGYASAKAQAAHPGQLIHRQGIPVSAQMRYSDILQYSQGYTMDGNTAVTNWTNSTGHRKQMQCASATEAAVGVFKSGNYTYYAIVYNFSGTNVGGN